MRPYNAGGPSPHCDLRCAPPLYTAWGALRFNVYLTVLSLARAVQAAVHDRAMSPRHDRSLSYLSHIHGEAATATYSKLIRGRCHERARFHGSLDTSGAGDGVALASRGARCGQC